jgi:hypothetical protein
MSEEQGPIRKLYFYFKRGKSEINFLLNIYQTIIIIWAGSQMSGGFWELVTYSVFFGIFLILISLVIGKYSLERVDPVTTFINPFTQDIVLYRQFMAKGEEARADFNEFAAMEFFKAASQILDKWIK